MSEAQKHDRTRELGELFVSVTGDETVTERQEDEGEKEPVDSEEFEEVDEGLDDGLDDAIDADLSADSS